MGRPWILAVWILSVLAMQAFLVTLTWEATTRTKLMGTAAMWWCLPPLLEAHPDSDTGMRVHPYYCTP